MIDYIKLEDCKDGYLYRISARNGRYGIFVKELASFTLSRVKWGDNYLFDEYHYDTGAPFGTVLPLKEIEKAPNFTSEEKKLEYLNKFQAQKL